MATPPGRPPEHPELAQQRGSGLLAGIRDRMAGAGLVRPARGRLLAGVLAGVAHRLGISAAVARVAFVVSILLPGPQFLLYVALWIMMPAER